MRIQLIVIIKVSLIYSSHNIRYFFTIYSLAFEQFPTSIISRDDLESGSPGACPYKEWQCWRRREWGRGRESGTGCCATFAEVGKVTYIQRDGQKYSPAALALLDLLVWLVIRQTMQIYLSIALRVQSRTIQGVYLLPP